MDYLSIFLLFGPMLIIMNATDLRQIIFATLPGAVENFDLLCRVAGRDGQPSTCVVVFDPRRDFQDDNRARGTPSSLAAVSSVVQELFHRSIISHPSGRFSLMADGRQEVALDISDNDLSSIYSVLESSLGCIELLGRQYAGCQFDVVPGHESVFATDRSPTGLAVVRHSVQMPEIGPGRFNLDIIRAAHKERLPDFMELTAKMNSLQLDGHVKVYPRKSLLILRLGQLLPEPGAQTEAVARWVHEQLLKKHEAMSRERNRLRELLLGNSCILAAMARHFGSQLPDGKTRCGRCPVCLSGKPPKARTFSPRPVNFNDIKAVLAAVPDHDSPRYLARVATGIHSPKVRYLGSYQSPVFGSMADCRFEVSRSPACRSPCDKSNFG